MRRHRSDAQLLRQLTTLSGSTTDMGHAKRVRCLKQRRRRAERLKRRWCVAPSLRSQLLFQYAMLLAQHPPVDHRREIDRLNRSVTKAILDAEMLPPGSEAKHAFRLVAEIEQKLAAILAGDTLEGEIARLGSVSAWMSAQEFVRAVALAKQYLEDPLSSGVRAKLQQLHDEADARAPTAESA